MIFEIIRWVNYAIVVMILLMLPAEVRRWFALRRVYGGIPWSLVWHMISYARMSSALRPQTTMAFVLLGLIIGSVLTELTTGHALFHDDTHSVIKLLLLFWAWNLLTASRMVLPSTVLFLGASQKENIRLLAKLNDALHPFRVVSLLTPNESVPTVDLVGFVYNNLRTENNYQWRTIVHHLMEVVPVIIVNISHPSEHVDAETTRARKRNLLYKAMFIQHNDAMPSSTEKHGARLDGKSSERLARELKPKICELVETQADLTRRLRAQEGYAAMWSHVSMAHRFNSSINGMLEKARDIQAWSYECYLRECKGISIHAADGRLLEDIPSIVSAADEQHYLQTSAGLEECENIFRGALELAKNTPGDQQAFNIANAHNKMGKLARLRRDWDGAKAHLNEAITRLETIVAGEQPDRFGDARQELADAHFFLGEVYWAGYRGTRSEADRAAAVEHFRVSNVEN